GAEVVFDERSGDDSRLLLTRRFLVNDDPDVGHFIIRDCDSVVSQREADAVAEWLASGLPFHSMRDWYTHTDVLLAGLWGGIARVFPDMSDRIEAFLDENPVNTNWDQLFLRQ